MISSDKARDLVREKVNRECQYLIEIFNNNLLSAISNRRTFFTVNRYNEADCKIKKRFCEELNSKGFLYYFKKADLGGEFGKARYDVKQENDIDLPETVSLRFSTPVIRVPE